MPIYVHFSFFQINFYSYLFINSQSISKKIILDIKWNKITYKNLRLHKFKDALYVQSQQKVAENQY